MLSAGGDWAALWRRGDGLSPGDRPCLALGERMEQDVLTADAARAGLSRVVLIR